MKKKTKLISALLTAVLLFGLLPAAPMKVKAEEITVVTAAMSPELNEICKLDNTITCPTFTTTSAGPAEVISESATWNLNGEDVDSGTFTEGLWCLWVPVVIDGVKNPEDTFSSSVALTVNGEPWNLDYVTPGDAEDPDWVAWFMSPYVVLGDKLVFVKDPVWNIPESVVNTPIAGFSVASGVSGGTPPYTFYKMPGGPSWIDVAEDGTVSGTPSKSQANVDLEIVVFDSKNIDSASITIPVGPTKPDAGLEAITEIRGSASTLPEDIAIPGKTLAPVDLTLSTADVYLDPSKEYWQKFNIEKGVFETKSFDTVFEGGYYRYWVTVCADKSKCVFISPSLNVDGINWTLASCSETETETVAAFYTDLYAVPYGRITITGVSAPVDGAMPSVSGITVQEEGVQISEAHWYYLDGSELLLTDDMPFDVFKQYYIELLLTGGFIDELGFAFSDTVSASVNGIEGSSVTVDYMNEKEIYVTALIPPQTIVSDLYVVTAGSLNVRDGASSNAGRIGGLKYGDVVQSCAESEGWVKILYNGGEGWVNKNYLKLTYTEKTAIRPVKYTVSAGALNVRDAPNSEAGRIGGLTLGKEVLVTGRLKDNQNKEWLVLDYEGQLGFIRADYAESESAKEETETAEVEVTVSGGVDAKITLVPYKSSIAAGKTVQLTEKSIGSYGDGYLYTTVYPDDAGSFNGLTIDNITLPAASGLVVTELTLNPDGSIFLKFGPVNPVTVTYETDGVSEITSMTVSSGDIVQQPADPTKEGFTFVAWYKDPSRTEKYDFEQPVTESITVYAGWKEIIPEGETVYIFSEGADGTWTRGSKTPFAIIVNRSADDDTTFSHFRSIEVDGTPVDEGNYTAASGSLKASLKADYLDTLSAGTHALKVNFDDGFAQTALTVAEAPADDGTSDNKTDETGKEGSFGYSGKEDPKKDISSDSTVKPESTKNIKAVDAASPSPTTGDGSNTALWLVLLMASAAGCVILLISKKRYGMR